MIYKIVIIGTGALGKRHLSSILNSGLPMDVYCYDINPKAMDKFEWKDTFHNKTLNIVSSFDAFPEEIDFALFAMTSKGRREMFDQLTDKKQIKNILFEKVLFQKPEDYDHVGSRLKALNIRAWVNCPRRQMESYQKLKKELADAEEMRISVSGGEWGMACNAIHELDIIEYLAGSGNTCVKELKLLPVISESRRVGFKEVYGEISGCSGRCRQFSLSCMKGTDVPDMMTITSDIGQYIIIEGKQKIICMTAKNGYELEERPFVIPYQSQMTQFVMEDILLKGTSRLTEFDESARLHLQLINPMIRFFEENGMEEGICPIT